MFSFLNFSLWQGMYIGRLKHRSSHRAFQNCPYPVLWRKACLSLTLNLIIVQCPGVYRFLGFQTKRPFGMLLSMKPPLIKAPWAHGKSSCPSVLHLLFLSAWQEESLVAIRIHLSRGTEWQYGTIFIQWPWPLWLCVWRSMSHGKGSTFAGCWGLARTLTVPSLYLCTPLPPVHYIIVPRRLCNLRQPSVSSSRKYH